MIEFQAYSAGYADQVRTVSVDPLAVIQVKETEMRPADSFWQQVAILILSNGKTCHVMDPNRTVLSRIADAQREKAIVR